MAAGVAVAAAAVSGAATYDAASVVVRRNRMVISVAGEHVLTDETVTRVERVGNRQWRITTGNGVFLIERSSKGCGCS